ncbi:MAG: protein translocase subunit SecD, partial [Rhizobiaceae bacterium]|nr:protein translocase subunit SecD [Rhizobiaceae bacterium]
MLYFSKWKIITILTLVTLALLFTAPNFVSKDIIASLPSWMPASQMKLGLDLRGGSHLLMQVDKESLTRERLESLEGDVRRILRAERIGYRLSKGDTRSINVRLRKAEDADNAIDKLGELTLPVTSGLFGRSSVVEVAASQPEDSLLVYSLTDDGLAHSLQSAATQSIEVIGRRINELGTNEPVVQRQGTDRILIQFPGLDDPQTLKDLIGTTAKLSFHLVSNAMDANDALTSRPPPGTKVLFEDTDPPTPYLIETRVMVDGENLVDSQAGFDSRTNEPIVSFRFDTKGASRFGKVTQNNVGRPFAIVLDGEIISAPVIREPILGGSGQISGNFSVEGANNLAILLRAGALPADLTIIEERTVGPGLGLDSIEAGKNASLIGAMLVLIFMWATYGTLGLIANVALIANISMIITLLSVLGATLTLPGIAGIVLTMGMAVDANVLIYERIREERRNGRNIIQSFDAGFKH